jgi:hypothetical protein
MSKVGDPALSKKVFWMLPSFLALACAPPYPYMLSSVGDLKYTHCGLGGSVDLSIGDDNGMNSADELDECGVLEEAAQAQTVRGCHQRDA